MNTIAKALMATWKEEKRHDTPYGGVVALEKYLEYNYKERYVALCVRLGLKPLSLGQWLRLPVSSVPCQQGPDPVVEVNSVQSNVN